MSNIKEIKIDLKEGYQILLQFRSKARLTRYRKDKYFPKVTQCLMFIDGLLEGYSEIIKHIKDEDIENEAILIVTEKLIKNVYTAYYYHNSIRKEVNKLINTI